MRKKQLFKRTLASALAVCMSGSTLMSGAVPLNAKAADPTDAQWEEIQSIISPYYGEWTDTTYPGQTTELMPDTALMGNGDVAVNSGGDAKTKTFYISKGDFWEYNGTQKAVGGYSITKKTEKQENPNIAPNYKTVTATPEDTWGLAEYGKEMAFSGEVDKYINSKNGCGWVSKPVTDGSPQWLQVEYEEPITVKKYVLYSDGGVRPAEQLCNSRDFQLQYSDDGENWNIADDVKDNEEGVYTKVLDEAVTAKFFRMYITNPVQPGFSGDIRAKVSQLEFYERESEEIIEKNLALNKPIEVSGAFTDPGPAYCPGTMLVDGQANTKWCSVPGNNNGSSIYWAVVDLGEEKDISRYVLKHAQAGGEDKGYNTRDFKIQYATKESPSGAEDGDWADADVVEGNTANITDKNLATPIKTRYVRVLVTKPTQTTDPAVRLYELELYAEPKEETSAVEFYEKQDILNAEVTTDMPFDEKMVSMETFTSATENAVITKLTSEAEETIALQAELWGKSGDANRPVSAVVNADGTVTVTRKTYNRNLADAKSYTSEVAMTTKVVGADAEADTTKNAGLLTFDLEPGASVYLVTTVGGGGKNYNGANEVQGTAPVEESQTLLDKMDSEAEIEDLKQAHADWWKDYWSASYVKLDTSDEDLDTIMKYYYAAQYFLGCTARDGEVAPGIMGKWCTIDNLKWWGHYQLNYNYNAPFYGANSSNRSDLSKPAFDQILEYKEIGEKNSETTSQLMRLSNEGAGAGNGYVQKMIDDGRIDPVNGIKDGLFYPVGITPWGQSMCPNLFHNETICAAYSSFPGVEYYNYTRDEEYLRDKLYDYLKGCATFYETWLEKNENGQYDIYAGYHENSWGRNPALELTTVYYLFDTIIEASERLGVDEDKRELWTEIRDNLAPQPTIDYNGKEVYSLAEKAWSNSAKDYVDMTTPIPADGNMIPLESWGQCNRYGYFSEPEQLEIARNTIDVFSGNGGWAQINNFPRIFQTAVRSRYDIDEIVNHFAATIRSQMQANLRIKDIYHGIEKSGATEAVNEMMMLTDDGITKIFPNWYVGKDAKFANLRAEGAFIVSAEYDGQAHEAKNVVINSEKGETMTLVSPWETGAVVKDSNGNVVETTVGTVPNWEDEKTITFDTTAGETYTVEKVVPSETFKVNVVGGSGSGEYGEGQTVRIEAELPANHYFVKWVSDDEEVVFADAEARSTSFKMPNKEVTVTAEMGKYPFIQAKSAIAGNVRDERYVPAVNLINNNGMSSAYELEAFHGNGRGADGMWHTTENPGEDAWVQVDLGDVYALDEMWVWNMNQANLSKRGLKNVKIEYSVNGNEWTSLAVPEGMTFTDGDAEYPFQFAQALGQPDSPATNLNDGKNTPVSFGGAEARYVKITANPVAGNGSWGDVTFGLSELRFTEAEEVDETVDKTWLSALIDYAHSQQEQKEYQYLVPAVKVPFEKALAEAIAVNDKADATQAEVDAVYDKLLDMTHYLGFTGNSKHLGVLIDEAKGLNKALYTKETWAALEDALAKAEEVFADENALQAEIDVAAEVLQKAMDGLEKLPVDKTKLDKLVTKAKKYEDAIEEYTDGTAEIFMGALENARKVLASEEVTQEEVNAAYEALQNAIFQLRLIPDKGKLDELIKAAEKVDISKYTAESASVFTAALDNAKAVFADSEATEEDVKAAEKELKDAQDNLVEKTDGSEGGNKPDDGDETDNGTVQTGDTTSVWGMLLACVVSAIMAAGVVFVRRKHR